MAPAVGANTIHSVDLTTTITRAIGVELGNPTSRTTGLDMRRVVLDMVTLPHYINHPVACAFVLDGHARGVKLKGAEREDRKRSRTSLPSGACEEFTKSVNQMHAILDDEKREREHTANESRPPLVFGTGSFVKPGDYLYTEFVSHFMGDRAGARRLIGRIVDVDMNELVQSLFLSYPGLRYIMFIVDEGDKTELFSRTPIDVQFPDWCGPGSEWAVKTCAHWTHYTTNAYWNCNDEGDVRVIHAPLFLEHLMTNTSYILTFDSIDTDTLALVLYHWKDAMKQGRVVLWDRYCVSKTPKRSIRRYTNVTAMSRIIYPIFDGDRERLLLWFISRGTDFYRPRKTGLVEFVGNHALVAGLFTESMTYAQIFKRCVRGINSLANDKRGAPYTNDEFHTIPVRLIENYHYWITLQHPPVLYDHSEHETKASARAWLRDHVATLQGERVSGTLAPFG